MKFKVGDRVIRPNFTLVWTVIGADINNNSYALISDDGYNWTGDVSLVDPYYVIFDPSYITVIAKVAPPVPLVSVPVNIWGHPINGASAGATNGNGVHAPTGGVSTQTPQGNGANPKAKFKAGDRIKNLLTHHTGIIDTFDPINSQYCITWSNGDIGIYGTATIDDYWILELPSEADATYAASNGTGAFIGIDPSQSPKEQKRFITLQEAILFDIESKKPKYSYQGEKWKKEGKCPQCGALGEYSRSVAVCPKHGEY